MKDLQLYTDERHSLCGYPSGPLSLLPLRSSRRSASADIVTDAILELIKSERSALSVVFESPDSVNRQRLIQQLTPSLSRNRSAPAPSSDASVANMPAIVQLSAATVTDLGASGTGQPVRASRMWP